MKSTTHPTSPDHATITSDLGALVVRKIHHGLVVSRISKKPFRDAGQSYESYIITGTDEQDVGLAGVVGIGTRRATFFCDRPRTTVQKEVILAALNSCFN